MLLIVGLGAINASFAQPGQGGGPPDPPRDTPGLDPFTLAAVAGAGYAGYRAFRQGKGGDDDSTG